MAPFFVETSPGIYDLVGVGPGHQVRFTDQLGTVVVMGALSAPTLAPVDAYTVNMPNGNPPPAYTINTGNAVSGNNQGGDVTIATGTGTGTGRWGQVTITATVTGAQSGQSSTHNALLRSNMTLNGLTTDFNPNSYDTYVTESSFTTDTSAFNYDGKIRAFYPHLDIQTASGSTITRVENTASLVNVLAAAAGTLTYGYAVSGELLHSSANYTVTQFDAIYGLVALLDNGSCGLGRGATFTCNDTSGKTGTFTTSAIGCGGYAQHSNAQTSPLNIGVQGNSNNGPGTLSQSTAIQGFVTQLDLGTTTVGYVIQVGTPTISGAGVISVITGLRVEPIYNTASNSSTTGGYTAYGARIFMPTQGGNTSGTNTMYGLVIDQGGSASGVGGTSLNIGIQVAVPNPTTSGTTTNRALYITGTGGSGGTSTNYALYCDSTRVSAFASALSVGTTSTNSNSLTLGDAYNIIVGTTTGTKIGTVGGAAGQKLAFWNSTPIVQPVLATGASHTVDDIITVLQNLGLTRQS